MPKLHHAPVAFGLIVGEGNRRIMEEAQGVLFACCETQEEIMSGSARRPAAPFAASLHRGSRQRHLGLMEGEPLGDNGVVTALTTFDQSRLQRNAPFSRSVRGMTRAAQQPLHFARPRLFLDLDESLQFAQMMGIAQGGDAELVGFIQRFLGYCLTGHTHEHVFMFIYGTGANGKGVFVNTVTQILGDYAVIAPMEMFLTSRFDRHPTEIARLKGARLVVAQETQRGRSWDEAKIKTLTSSDTLTGRFMRGNFFDFTPSHKLIITGNYKPTVRNADEAMRRRLLLVPFTVQIPPAERDPKLAEKLKAEWPAILRWMAEGYMEWQRGGLRVPELVRKATDQYLSDQDALARWIEEWVATDSKPDDFTSTGMLFASWKLWCEERNLPAGTETAFAESLSERGYVRARKKKYGRGFNGIALKPSNAPDQQ